MVSKNNIPAIQVLVVNNVEDFDFFKYAETNRKVRPNKALYENISKHGLLPYYPIVVTPEHIALDGQNRIAMAMEVFKNRMAEAEKNNEKVQPMNIYYIVDDTTTSSVNEKILLPNIARKDWVAEDWLNYYAKQNNEVYKEFELAVKELPFSGLGNNMVIFSHGKTSASKFKKGKLQGDTDFYKKIVTFLKEVNCKLNGKTPFLKAIVDFFDTYVPQLSEDQMKTFSSRLGQEEVEQTTKDAYIKRFLTLCGMNNAKVRDKFIKSVLDALKEAEIK